MKRTFTLLFLFGLLNNVVEAQEWTGAVSSDWNNQANWNDWPLNDEDLTINPLFFTGAMAAPVISANSVFIPERIFVVNGGTLTIAANLTVERMIIEGDGSSITMTNGTLTAERLIAESGGMFTLENGTVTGVGVLGLGDNATEPSRMIMNGGTMNVTGEFGFDVVLEESEPYFELNAGTLTVNGDAVWYSEAPGAGRGKVIINGGTAEINGPVYSNPGGPLELHLLVTGGSLTINGPVLDLSHSTDSIHLTGGAFYLQGNMVVENDGVFHATGGDVFFDQQTELRGVGSFHFHDLTISTGASLTHTDPSEISVSGNWMNFGTFDGDENTVAFVGSTTQQIEATNFHGLRVANSGGGIELNGPCTVSGELDLENGIIHTAANTLLTLLANATANSGSQVNYIDGPLRKVGDDSFVFPVGDNGKWRRIAIGASQHIDTEFTAEYFDMPYTNTTSLGPLMLDVSTTEYWSLERTGLPSTASVTLHWEDANESGIDSCDGLVVAHWDGTEWLPNPSSTTGGCTGTDAGTVATTGVVSVYDVFTLGTADPSVGITDLEGLTPSITFDMDQRLLSFHNIAPGSDLTIFNARGTLVHQQDLGTSDKVIGLPAIAPGVYHAHVRSAAGGAYLKFVAIGR